MSPTLRRKRFRQTAVLECLGSASRRPVDCGVSALTALGSKEAEMRIMDGHSLRQARADTIAMLDCADRGSQRAHPPPPDAFLHGVLTRMLDLSNGRPVTVRTPAAETYTGAQDIAGAGSVLCWQTTYQWRSPVLENRTGEAPIPAGRRVVALSTGIGTREHRDGNQQNLHKHPHASPRVRPT